MIERIFRRKIYEQIKQWKEENTGKSALLIKGARRVSKTIVVEQFAQNEYESYILIDFNKYFKQIKELFVTWRILTTYKQDLPYGTIYSYR